LLFKQLEYDVCIKLLISMTTSLKELFFIAEVLFIFNVSDSGGLSGLDHGVDLECELLHGDHVEVVHDQGGVLG